MCVCQVSTQGLEELAEWIFLKFCMKLDDVVNSDTTEPDFRFSISFRTYCPKSVKNGRFSRFLAIFPKTVPTIFLIFWYVVELIVGYHTIVVTCLAKIFSGSYGVRTVSEKVPSVRSHYLRWFLIFFEKADIFWDRSMFELRPYQISGHFNHPVKSYGCPKMVKIDLFSKRNPFYKSQYLLNHLSIYAHILHDGRSDWERVIYMFRNITCPPKHAQTCPDMPINVFFRTFLKNW